jgi:hypothetical protein
MAFKSFPNRLNPQIMFKRKDVKPALKKTE